MIDSDEISEENMSSFTLESSGDYFFRRDLLVYNSVLAKNNSQDLIGDNELDESELNDDEIGD
ncbi:MAG TPA: hypothetical protein PLD88_13815 [Candidatus Berkiella sp.]|nr:hypothetical protein [Candidatus Berkiella sp.]